MPKTTLICCLILLPAVGGGCAREDIKTYTAPRDEPLSDVDLERIPSAPPVPRQMLAAILPQGDKTWFFKLTGDPDKVAGLHEQFGRFVASTSFDNGRPTWEIPDSWTEEKGHPGRFTTLHIGDTDLELTVTELPSQADRDRMLLANANRWRGQLGLVDLSMNDFLAKKVPEGEGEIAEIQTRSGKAVLFDIIGAAPADGGGPPFAGMAGHPPIGNLPMQGAGAPPSGGPSYDKPENWKQGRLNSMRFAAFEVGQGMNKAEITITSFGGDLLSNFNRWRGMVGLAPWSASEMAENLKTLKAGKIEIHYAKLFGNKTSILGGIFEHGGRTWFVKMSGPTELVKTEVPRFEAFASSIRFE